MPTVWAEKPSRSAFFVDAGDERLTRSSTTSRADELKISFIKFLICSYKFLFIQKN